MLTILQKLKERPKTFQKNSKESTDIAIQQKAQAFFAKTYEKYNKEFEKHVSPVISLSPEGIICAEVANESYSLPSARKTEISGFTLDKKLSTSDVAIYTNTNKKICIIGYRGTIITDIKDLSSDAQIVLDIQGIDPRVKNSLRIYDICKRTFLKYSFRVCGHSLGGTLSYIVAKHREADKCIVFNPGVSLNTFFFQILEDTISKTSWTTKTETYKILGDIISAAAFVGHTNVFSIESKDPLQIHAMENFLLEKNSIDKTNPKTKDN